MPSYALGVSYLGTGFHGWQRQADVATVQGELERALTQVATVPTPITAAGRTDAGVHASGQVCGFHAEVARDEDTWRRALNALTDQRVVIDWVQATDDTFHPRFSAIARRYLYVFSTATRPQPFLADLAWRCSPLDADAMHRAAALM